MENNTKYKTSFVEKKTTLVCVDITLSSSEDEKTMVDKRKREKPVVQDPNTDGGRSKKIKKEKAQEPPKNVAKTLVAPKKEENSSGDELDKKKIVTQGFEFQPPTSTPAPAQSTQQVPQKAKKKVSLLAMVQQMQSMEEALGKQKENVSSSQSSRDEKKDEQQVAQDSSTRRVREEDEEDDERPASQDDYTLGSNREEGEGTETGSGSDTEEIKKENERPVDGDQEAWEDESMVDETETEEDPVTQRIKEENETAPVDSDDEALEDLITVDDDQVAVADPNAEIEVEDPKTKELVKTNLKEILQERSQKRSDDFKGWFNGIVQRIPAAESIKQEIKDAENKNVFGKVQKEMRKAREKGIAFDFTALVRTKVLAGVEPPHVSANQERRGKKKGKMQVLDSTHMERKQASDGEDIPSTQIVWRGEDPMKVETTTTDSRPSTPASLAPPQKERLIHWVNHLFRAIAEHMHAVSLRPDHPFAEVTDEFSTQSLILDEAYILSSAVQVSVKFADEYTKIVRLFATALSEKKEELAVHCFHMLYMIHHFDVWSAHDNAEPSGDLETFALEKIPGLKVFSPWGVVWAVMLRVAADNQQLMEDLVAFSGSVEQETSHSAKRIKMIMAILAICRAPESTQPMGTLDGGAKEKVYGDPYKFPVCRNAKRFLVNNLNTHGEGHIEEAIQNYGTHLIQGKALPPKPKKQAPSEEKEEDKKRKKDKKGGKRKKDEDRPKEEKKKKKGKGKEKEDSKKEGGKKEKKTKGQAGEGAKKDPLEKYPVQKMTKDPSDGEDVLAHRRRTGHNQIQVWYPTDPVFENAKWMGPYKEPKDMREFLQRLEILREMGVAHVNYPFNHIYQTEKGYYLKFPTHATTPPQEWGEGLHVVTEKTSAGGRAYKVAVPSKMGITTLGELAANNAEEPQEMIPHVKAVLHDLICLYTVKAGTNEDDVKIVVNGNRCFIDFFDHTCNGRKVPKDGPTTNEWLYNYILGSTSQANCIAVYQCAVDCKAELLQKIDSVVRDLKNPESRISNVLKVWNSKRKASILDALGDVMRPSVEIADQNHVEELKEGEDEEEEDVGSEDGMIVPDDTKIIYGGRDGEEEEASYSDEESEERDSPGSETDDG